ncbi:MAG: FHA domain-containing protein [Bacilli bacterium]|nr:FHA domain-containing protein [Bacilli bacterium]
MFNCGSDIEYLDIITINEANLPKVSSPENTNSKYFRVCRACGAKIYFEDIEEYKATCPECDDPDLMNVPLEQDGVTYEVPHKANIPEVNLKLVEITTKKEITIPEKGGIIGKEGTIEPEYMQRFRFLSRKHLEVCYRNRQWFVKDLGSTNGTYLDQATKLKPFEEYQLHHNTVLRLADVKFQVIIE